MACANLTSLSGRSNLSTFHWCPRFLAMRRTWRKTLGARREPTTNSTQYGTGPKSSPCRIGGSRALPPLRHPCSDRVCKEEDQKGFAPLSKCFPERYVSPTSFSLNLLAFCRECFSLLGYLLSLISIVDSEQLSGVQLLTKYWLLLCFLEVFVNWTS